MLKNKNNKQKRLIAGLCFYVGIAAVLQPSSTEAQANDATKLQGQIEQLDGNNQSNDKLKLGNAVPGYSYLKGKIQQEDGQVGKETPVSAQGDPDIGDKELMVEWDRWRNRFLQAVLSGTTDILTSDQGQNYQFNPQTKIIESKYPLGVTAWFSCKITRDCQIKEVLIEQPSGYPGYDEAVREAVKSLAGSAILKFPSRSRRISVLQAGGVERTSQADKQYFRFGDVEHYHVPVH